MPPSTAIYRVPGGEIDLRCLDIGLGGEAVVGAEDGDHVEIGAVGHRLRRLRGVQQQADQYAVVLAGVPLRPDA